MIRLFSHSPLLLVGCDRDTPVMLPTKRHLHSYKAMRRRTTSRRSNFRRSRRGGNGGGSTVVKMPSSPWQKSISLCLPGTAVFLSSSGAGGIATATSSAPVSSVSNFATRFAGFQEYRQVKVVWFIWPIDTDVGGSSAFWMQESATAPTLVLANQNSSLFVNNGLAPPILRFKGMTRSGYKLDGRMTDTVQQEWTAMGAAAADTQFLACYTDNATLGTPAAANKLWGIQPYVTVELRGYT